MKHRISTGPHRKTGREFTALLQVFVFVLCVACVTLAFGVGTAHAANHTMGQLAGGKGTYSDGDTISFGKTFTAAPVVVVNACDTSGNPLAAAATDVTTTGFTVKICDLDGYAIKTGNTVSTATVQWIAIIPDPDNPKVKAGCTSLEIDTPVNFNPVFSSNPIVLCSAYDGVTGLPLLASFYNLDRNGFAAMLNDVDGNRAMGSFSWIAIDLSGYPNSSFYDEAVLIGNYTMYNSNAHISYGYPISTLADLSRLVVLSCGQKNSNAAYCTSSSNNSLTGFDLGLLDYDGNSGTNVWTSWVVFGINQPGTHMVFFDENIGSPLIHAIEYTDASNHAGLPLNPIRNGWHFVGWNTKADGSGTAYTTSMVVTEDLTVYAMWAHTVTFNKNNGDTEANPAAKSVILPATTVDSLPTPPSRSGYHFAGWNTQSNGLGSAFTASTAVSADITVYAVWTPIYTVIFDKNNGDTEASPKTATTDLSMHVTLPAATPSRSGYLFTGWNTKDDGLGSAFTASTAVSADITVYAVWTPVYTVTFDKNGGDTDAGPATKTVTTPATTVGTLPAPPGRSGYHFAGWNTQSDGHGTAFTASTAVTADIRVYAMWTPIYNVTFDRNGGDTDASPKTVTTDINMHVALPSTNPARAGYNFMGWNTKADGSGGAFTASMAVTGNTTVYAIWLPAYIVTFDKNGGDTDVNPKTAVTDTNGHVTLPAAPTKTGYEFTAWNTSPDGSGAIFTSSTVVNSNMTVYAQWRATSYTVLFDPQNGNGASSSTASYSTAIQAPVQPSRYGYNFTGWYTASGELVSFPYLVTQNITMYAGWSPQPQSNYLAGVTPSSGQLSPAFNKTTTSYKIILGEYDTSFTLTPIKEFDGAQMTINGKALSSYPVSLENGKSAKITVKLTYAKKSKTYTFTVIRAKSTNNSLASLTASAGTWSQPFDPNVLSYTLKLDENTKSATIKAASAMGKLASISPASSKVTLNNGASKSIKFTVKAQSGAKRTYTVTVVRAASANADLKSLKVSGKGCALSPVFSAGQTSYTVNMPPATDSITISAKALGYKAAVSIDGGKASKKVTLASGASVTVRVVVTAQSGNTKEYLITITRPPLPAQ